MLDRWDQDQLDGFRERLESNQIAAVSLLRRSKQDPDSKYSRMTTSGLFIVVTVLLLLIGLKMFRLDVLSTKGFILLGSIAVCLVGSFLIW